MGIWNLGSILIAIFTGCAVSLAFPANFRSGRRDTEPDRLGMLSNTGENGGITGENGGITGENGGITGENGGITGNNGGI